jgi:hypothetical protein
MKVLIACEFSGIVRDAFRARGHDAWSCDLLPSESDNQYHIQRDVLSILDDDWGLMIAHPTCTRLCNSGVRWLSNPPPGRTRDEIFEELEQGAALFSALWNAKIPKICIENPVMHKHAKAKIENYQPFEQSIQPWQFGHGETKRTCLWLKGLPDLVPTDIVGGRDARVHLMSPGANRWKERSRFFPGIAAAMADQWGVE